MTLTAENFTPTDDRGFRTWQADRNGSVRANFCQHSPGAVRKWCWQAYCGPMSVCDSADTQEEAIEAINAALPVLHKAAAELALVLADVLAAPTAPSTTPAASEVADAAQR